MALASMDVLAGLPPMISVETMCTVLGLSRSAGYRAVATGDIPTLRMGRRLWVPTPKLLSMLGALGDEGKPARVTPRAG